jgi:hypothetical protein
MENKWASIYFLANEKLTLGMRYSRYFVINARSHQISYHKYKIQSININQWNYAMWHWKTTRDPLQISINKGHQPRERGIPWDTNFLQDKLFKQGSSPPLQARKLSQRVLKPPSSMLEVYKERSSVGSSLNAL